MMGRDTLKTLYGLQEDTSDIQSNLVIWYNEVINKCFDELNVRDVSRLIRQKILLPIAIDKAIEILSEDPFAGELSDGDLLATVVDCFTTLDIERNENGIRLIKSIKVSEENDQIFEWDNEISKETFFKSVVKLKQILSIS